MSASSLLRRSACVSAVDLRRWLPHLSLWPAQWLTCAHHVHNAQPSIMHASHQRRVSCVKTMAVPAASTSNAASSVPVSVAIEAIHGASSAPGAETYQLKVEHQDMPAGKGTKLRLDTFLAARLSQGHRASRAKVQSAIKAKQVTINGKTCDKPSAALSRGDAVICTLLPGPSLEALPEDIPLDIVYEDEHLMVINKPAGMPVHISVGHHSGTLVNALLAHCGLPGVRIDPTYPSNIPTEAQQGGAGGATSLEALGAASRGDVRVGEVPALMGGWVAGDDEEEGVEEEEEDQGEGGASSLAGGGGGGVLVVGGAGGAAGVLRPGIVHRLDIGTSGLLVVAKREVAQRALAAQFKARTVGRIYHSLTIGCPTPPTGKVMTNIDRDPNDRKRMAALSYGGARGRTASSNYQVVEQFGGGAAALVQWKLDTGRTHQIRVHAKHLGHPLLADATYGGGAVSAAAVISQGRPSIQPVLKTAMECLNRPALHARSLAFDHPHTGRRLSFECDLPDDLKLMMSVLRGIDA